VATIRKQLSVCGFFILYTLSFVDKDLQQLCEAELRKATWFPFTFIPPCLTEKMMASDSYAVIYSIPYRTTHASCH
jgi:hypothetical protein